MLESMLSGRKQKKLSRPIVCVKVVVERKEIKKKFM